MRAGIAFACAQVHPRIIFWFVCLSPPAFVRSIREFPESLAYFAQVQQKHNVLVQFSILSLMRSLFQA